MKSSDALLKAIEFYRMNGVIVIHIMDGALPRLIAYNRETDRVALVIVRRPRSKNYYARQRGCREAVANLESWCKDWKKANKWDGVINMESIAVYADGEMDRVFHGCK